MYFGQSRQCCNFDGLDSSYHFQVFQIFTKLLVIVPSVPITIAIIVTFKFHIFFRSKYSSLFSLALIFTLWSVWRAKSPIRPVLLFFLNYHYVWFLARIWFVSQNPRGVCSSHSPVWISGCAFTIRPYGRI